MTKSTPLLSDEEARIRAQIYQQQRLESQKEFYRSRIDEFRFNANCMLYSTAALMGVSTTLSVLSISRESAGLMLITAILPAIAAALAAFRAVYQWERQLTLYKGTLIELRRAGNVMVGVRPNEYHEVFPTLVQRTEGVFQNEAGQWGQLKGVMPTDGAKGAELDDGTVAGPDDVDAERE